MTTANNKAVEKRDFRELAPTIQIFLGELLGSLGYAQALDSGTLLNTDIAIQQLQTVLHQYAKEKPEYFGLIQLIGTQTFKDAYIVMYNDYDTELLEFPLTWLPENVYKYLGIRNYDSIITLTPWIE